MPFCVYCAWILSCRGRRDGVYQKSYKRAFRPLIYLLPRARVSRTSHAWRERAVRDKAKVGSFAALRGFSQTTRANISHEKAEQIRARIVCTPAEKRLGGRESNMCVDGMESALFIFSIGCIWTLSCRGRRYPVSATPTHTLCICVNSHDDPYGREIDCSAYVSFPIGDPRDITAVFPAPFRARQISPRSFRRAADGRYLHQSRDGSSPPLRG